MQSATDGAYQEIANAVVIQAAEDYRNALKGKSYAKTIPPEILRSRLERFFRSKWFSILTKIDGEYLIERLNKEHLENNAEKEKK